jgi:putative methionine-R-sulfoxide reductase with GAF domain
MSQRMMVPIMSPQAGSVPDLHSEAQFPQHERRLRIRHKVHSPAYAAIAEQFEQTSPHLNEIVDISEDGICFQNLFRVDAGEGLNLNLDLSETRAYINITGTVVWSDASGRTGIVFDKLPSESLRQLKEWLFVNTIIANWNSSDDLVETIAGEEREAISQAESETPLIVEHTSILAAVAAIGKEVEFLGPNVDTALKLVADRARTLTHATGAAIALTGSEDMICRASSGQDAPPMGALLHVGSGFSGECVRTGKLMECEDSEIDPHVDRESCRALGVRSMIAVPIHGDNTVVGLLEVFSPQAKAFVESDKAALQQLAGIVAGAIRREIHEMATAAHAGPEAETSSQAGFQWEEPAPSLLFRRILLVAIIVVILLLVGLVVYPLLRTKPTTAIPPVGVTTVATSRVTNSLEELRHLAENGDAAAQYAMGAHYATGEGVKQDYVEAAHWFGLAADRGHVAAQSTMAAYYWAGNGVTKDLQKAYFWAILAQAGGDEASKLRASVLAARINRQEILAAQRQANEWLKQHQLNTNVSSLSE